MSPILAQILSVGVSVGAGALGKFIGNSPVTGRRPWGKVLAPIVVAGAAYGMSAATGLQVTPLDVLGQGGIDTTVGAGAEIAGQSILLYTLVKNSVQLARWKRPQ